ncbi:MAG TPA: ABC transporter ATP-binding protein [Anaerolineae bacterium]|nr:ABC transporter ATP-binding protein [Anaerolineae bacterium]
MTLLEIENLHVAYGSIQALRGISLQVEAGELVTIVGSNGAGKSTTLLTLSGILRPSNGSIRFEGRDLSRAAPQEIVRRGISHCPEGRLIFGRLSVAENLILGAYHRQDKAEIQRDIERIYDLFTVLAERKRQAAGTLSGGEQQMLAIGRALMSRPRVLLLDEPSLGLAPKLVEVIFNVIQDLHRQGVTILLVEQNAFQALRVANRAYVLETGKIRLAGLAADLIDNPLVRSAYLGG